jgi:peroxiredoxin
MLRNKTPAPDFALRDASGIVRSLADLRGDSILLLSFFRGAYCPSAQRDLTAYADVYSRITALGAAMAAVSVDTPHDLRHLRDRLDLPFPLLSDSNFAVSRLYEIYESDETYEGPQPHGEPAVYIIDSDGHIADHQIQTGPKGSASPAEMALMLLYMQGNQGHYW